MAKINLDEIPASGPYVLTSFVGIWEYKIERDEFGVVCCFQRSARCFRPKFRGETIAGWKNIACGDLPTSNYGNLREVFYKLSGKPVKDKKGTKPGVPETTKDFREPSWSA